MSKGINCLNDSVLEQFLGADGIEELKTKVVEVIVEGIRNQLRNSSEYILSPHDIYSEIFDRVVNDVYEEIRDEYKQKISEAVEKKLSGLGI